MSVPAEPRNDASVLVVGESAEARAVLRCLTREQVACRHVGTVAEALTLIGDDSAGVLVVISTRRTPTRLNCAVP